MSSENSPSDLLIRYDSEEVGDEEVEAKHVIHDRADSHITIKENTLGGVFGNKYRIPDYQREYQWEEEEWGELWGELENLIDSDLTPGSLSMTDVFFGSMFFSERDPVQVLPEVDDEVFDVIDGQQRLTTLSILLKLIADQLKNNLAECNPSFIGKYSHHVGDTNNLIYFDSDPESNPNLILANQEDGFFEAIMNESKRLEYLLNLDWVNDNTKYGAIEVSTYLNTFDIDEDDYLNALLDDSRYEESDGSRPNLNPSRQSRISGCDDIGDLSEGDRNKLLNNMLDFDLVNERLIECYQYFNNKVESLLTELDESERRFRLATNLKNYLMNSFKVGYIEVEDEEPKLLMKIFEVLNDRGVDLKQTDIIRTRIINRLRQDSENEEEYNEYVAKWESIMNEFDKDSRRVLDFLSTYFVIREENVYSRGQVSNQLLEAFTLEMRDDESKKLTTKLHNIEETKNLIDTLKIYAAHYNQITAPKEYDLEFSNGAPSDLIRECERILYRLNNTSTDIWEPIVLGYYHDVVENNIDELESFRDVLLTIESFVIRFHVTGDVNAKDDIYIEAMKKYSENGIEANITEGMVQKAFERDNSVFGESLVEAISEENWSANMAKQVLRKIDSKKLATQEDELVIQELNWNDELVTLEHIFPQKPLLNGDKKYEWIRNFFNAGDVTISEISDIEQEPEYNVLVAALIDQEKDKRLEELAEEYIHNLGNMALLHHRRNNRISNEEYSRKLSEYAETIDYEQLYSSQYIRRFHLDLTGFDDVRRYYIIQDIYSEISDENIKSDVIDYFDRTNNGIGDLGEFEANLKSKAEAATSRDHFIQMVRSEYPEEEFKDSIKEFNSLWTVDQVADNLKHIIEGLLPLLEFDVEPVDDEFNSVDVDLLVDHEFNRREGTNRINYRRYIDS